MSHHIDVSFDHPANAGLLRYLARRSGQRTPQSVAPESVLDPYYRLGTHPDLVARLWDEITVRLPVDCRWVVYSTPVLAHPQTGIVFAFAGGTHSYALRLPEHARLEAVRAGATRVHSYTGGSTLDLSEIGQEWIFGNWFPGESDWCVAAYEFAGSPSHPPDATA